MVQEIPELIMRCFGCHVVSIMDSSVHIEFGSRGIKGLPLVIVIREGKGTPAADNATLSIPI